MKRLRAIALGAAALSCAAAAFAQRLDPRTPQTLVVGPPRGPSPTARGDAARRGRALVVPSSPRIAWRKTLEKEATPIAPLVRANGDLVVVTSKGELYELDPQGNEKTRLSLSSDTPQAASLLSDDAVLIATLTPEGQQSGLVLVRGGSVVARRRFGADRDAEVRRTEHERGVTSTLPLDDGGAVIGLEDQLIALDRDANVRARASLPAVLRSSLVVVEDAIYGTLATGSIVSWRPGGEIRRIGRFSGAVSGSAVRVAPGILAGVVDAQNLMRFDVVHGSGSETIFAGSSGTTLGPPSAFGKTIALLGWQSGRTSVIELDVDGRERRRTQVGLTASDASVPPSAPSEVLIDGEGRIAFATPEGIAGVVDRDGTSRTLGETICPKGRGRPGSAPVVGLAATSTGFVIACDNGTLLGIE
jgi:hypothetical protein